ncbi:MAG: ascorbate-dependent monooxygenase [Planctomycetes bacterium]|nr:ascorbate-dependent monooxygenase [Planctomycetota bacterium]
MSLRRHATRLARAGLALPALWIGTALVPFSPRGEADEPPVTWTRDIAPIVWKNCATCHRPGQVAPFSLLSYHDAAKRARHIDEVVSSGRMPPWKPEAGFGDFLDCRKLAERDVDLIARWVRDGAKEGDAAALPPPPRFTDGWALGEPDLVLEMPDSFPVPADGADIYRCFVIPTKVTEDRMVAAVEFRPGNRRVVHHAIFYLDRSGAARRRDEADPGPGYASFGGPGFLPTGGLGGWAPGATPRRLADGTARVLGRGSDLALQVHYHPDGKPEEDRSSLGIYFATAPVSKVVAGIPLIRGKFTIPAGEERFRLATSFTVPVDLHAVGIIPHMHLLGREMKIVATLPDGRLEPLVYIKDWDFNWQDQYQYARPVALPKGTRLDLEAYYDNSATNPKNPNLPPKPVKHGEQTTDEMCLCFVQVTADEPGGLQELRGALLKQRLLGLAGAVGSFGTAEEGGKGGVAGATGAEAGAGSEPAAGGDGAATRPRRLRQILQRFDKDGDGKLSEEEREAAMQELFGR